MKKIKQRREEMEKPRHEATTRTALPNLPIEITDKIFLSLSTKTLFELRCVIRDYSRFHNPHFIKMHLNRQIEIDNGYTFIITTASKIYKIEFGYFGNFYRAIKLDFPFRNPTCTSQIVLAGSCNGLLCLTHRLFYGKILYLWNPITGEYKQLPPHNLNSCMIVLGFGYDHSSGKFKVVVISQTPEPKFGQDKVEAAVHTMGTNSWRSIGELEYSFWNSRSKVFEGCPYWIVHRVKPVVSRSEFVVSFSVGDEKFKEIPLPPLDNGMRLKNLTALGGRLSIFSYVYKLKCYELWVRMNDKLENTWTKQLSFNELDINGDGYINPLGFKNGLVLLQDRYDGPLFFDPVTSDVKALYLRGQPKEFLVYPYIESLAMLTVEDRGDVHQNS